MSNRNSLHSLWNDIWDQLICLKSLLKFPFFFQSSFPFYNFFFQPFINHSYWTDDGCKMVSVEGSNVECECEHLTSFAVLMQIVPVWEQCLTLYPVSLIGGLVLSNEYNIFLLFISQPLRRLCHRKKLQMTKIWSQLNIVCVAVLWSFKPSGNFSLLTM